MSEERKNGSNTATKKSEIDKNSARRKVLTKTIAGGVVVSTGVMSNKWRKPVLDAVVLPGHAQTTDGSGSSGEGVTTTSTPNTTEKPA